MFNIRSVLIGGLLLVLAVAGYFYLTARPRIVLPDGTTLMLRDYSLGMTNVFMNGSSVERLLGNLIPNTGLKLGKWTFRRPTASTNYAHGVSSVYLQFEAITPTNSSGQFYSLFYDSYSNYRVLHWGDDGFVYEAMMMPFQASPNAAYLYVSDQNYSRSSRRFHFQFQTRENYDEPWRELGTVSIKNPARASAAQWSYADYPVVQTNGDMVCRLGEVQVRNSKAETSPGNSQYVLQVPFQLMVNGDLATNWVLHRMVSNDSAGGIAMFGFNRGFTNDWLYYRSYRSPDPYAVWRVTATAYEQPEMEASNVFNLNIPAGVSGSNQVALGSATISYEMRGSGLLFVNLQTNSAPAGLRFLQAMDAQGAVVSELLRGHQQRGTNEFMFPIPPQSIQSPLILTFALVKEVEFEFTVKPRLVKEFTKLPPIAE